MSFASFLAEAQELLSGAEGALLDLAESPHNHSHLEALFRHIHTLKGSAGIFSLEEVVHLAHLFESVLDHCRQGYPVTSGLHRLFLDVHDVLVELLRFYERRGPGEPGEAPEGLEELPEALLDRVDLLKGRLLRHQEQRCRVQEDLPQAEEAFEGCFLFGEDEEAEEEEEAPSLAPPGLQQALRLDSGSQELVKMTRVNNLHLDALIELLGELFTISTRLKLAGRRLEDTALLEVLVQQDKLMEKLHDNALSLRMAEVGEVFSRFRRLVLQLNQELGKDARLELEGEDTELDKTILDKLTDPLTHLLRNSMDHGLEPPEERVRQGKPAQGVITLRARRESGSVIVELEDDGRGLNRERILAKARSMGLVSGEMSPEHPEVPELIFHPGFSTCDSVSSVSGRGVGMDAVKEAVEALRGRITIKTRAGQGARFTLTLPSHMELIHGFYVRVHDIHMVIPMEQVLYCNKVPQEVRGSSLTGFFERPYLPYVHVERCLGLAPSEPPEVMVVVQHGGRPVGLLVHALLGSRQAVVKPMGEIFKDHPLFHGATIQGDNTLAICLDTTSLIEHALELRAVKLRPSAQSPSVSAWR